MSDSDVKRAERAATEAQDKADKFRGETEALRADVARLRATIEDLLKSAVPNPVEHPTMWAAWARARAVLGVGK